jgi:hypothetical protein
VVTCLSQAKWLSRQVLNHFFIMVYVPSESGEGLIGLPVIIESIAAGSSETPLVKLLFGSGAVHIL